MERIEARATEWRLVDGEVIGLNLATQEYYAVRGSGATLWPLLVDGATTAELVAALVERYRVDEGAAERDVSRLLDTLRAQGLLATGR